MRPAAAGLGLTALAPAAAAAWNTGDKSDALVQQVMAGAVSVEVYYQSGAEMS